MDNPNSNPLKLKPHHMLVLFMALTTCNGLKFNFSTICFEAFEIFPHIFDLRNELWFFDQSPIHFDVPLHVLRRLAHYQIGGLNYQVLKL
jgi:hypothetical protein